MEHSDVLARPEQPLITHLEETMNYMEHFLSLKFPELMELGMFIGYLHDIGKAARGIQDTLKRGVGARGHAILSAWITLRILNESKSLEREFVKLTNLSASDLKKLVFWVIASHHSRPSVFLPVHQRNYLLKKDESFFQLPENFEQLLKPLANRVDIQLPDKCELEEFMLKLKHQNLRSLQWVPKNLDFKTLFSTLSGSLNLSDWKSAGFREEFKLELNNRDRRRFVERVSSAYNPNFTLAHKNLISASKLPEKAYIELPTGFGKTSFSYFYFIKTHSSRLLYTLPITTIIDDIFSRFNETVARGNKSLQPVWYTSLFLGLSKDIREDDTLEETYKIHKFLLRPIAFTTLDQVLLPNLNSGRYPPKVFVNQKAFIVIDEPQLYGFLPLAILVKMLELGYFNHEKMLVMSATIPAFLKEKLDGIGFSDLEKQLNLSRKLDIPNRTALKYYTKTLVEKDSEGHFVLNQDVMNRILQDVLQGKNVIVKLNTVKKSQHVLQQIQNVISKKELNIDVQLFHARFIARDRQEKLSKAKEGDTRGPNSKKGVILVATQVIEAGVDISYDKMYTEIQPLDSLVQSAGRVNRQKDNPKNIPATIEVFEILDYHPYDPDLIRETRKVLSKYQLLPETEYTTALNEYWSSITSIFARKLNLADTLVKQVLDRGIFSLEVEDWKDLYKIRGIREGIVTVPVVPIVFYDDIEKLTHQYRGLILTRKVFQYMVNVPIYTCINYCPKEPLLEDYPWIHFINLQYDAELGLFGEMNDID